MLLSLWRRLWKNNLGPSGGDGSQRNRHLSFRPQLEPLEDRMLAASGAFTGHPPIDTHPVEVAINNMKVTVVENSPKTVIDLGAVFAKMSGIRYENGLHLSMMGNTNCGLVKTTLSENELTLNYTPGKSGNATIIVGAADADGVTVLENIFVTVLP